MPAPLLLKKYIWLFETVYNNGPISLEDISNRYEIRFGGGEQLCRRTFFRYKTAIEELFGIEILFDRAKDGYVVANKEDVTENSMQQWILQTFSVNTMLSENQDLKSRILLEHIPSGQQYLQPIMEAMRANKVLHVSYNSFRKSAEIELDIEPWCIKYFEQRWYLFGKEKDKQFVKDSKEGFYFLALDRVKDDKLSIQAVAIYVDVAQCPYLRTVPLHHSQVEVEREEYYSIFEYYLCPTFDFRQKLFSLSDSIEVLAPKELADMMKKDAAEMVRAYNYTEEQGGEYEFKIHKKKS